MIYGTPLFDRISTQKKERILSYAGKEFAQKGYVGANINVIAKNIGISVGSLYQYFGTKENLFLATVHRGRRELEVVIEKNAMLETSFLGKIENLIEAVQVHSRRNPDSILLYAELTAEGNNSIADRLSSEMETITARYYTELISYYQKKGIITNKGEPHYLAFFIDNLLLTLQFSYVNAYYRERMKVFLHKENVDNDETLKEALTEFISNSLGVTNE
ncbi:TetR/AcrR family transcriptional regulator [Spirochaeta cellobiosiphila]|uniref:TetR/AcrR family transcriptional regulator n=1 Tax=Spirochaeta cellobiosiphila TaxID=504483 RepID=UPI000413B737|nr:TetR/AcrR family transcriptional regulator [Spirochaeta cellobiosiphila]